jgi:hypothetical protein
VWEGRGYGWQSRGCDCEIEGGEEDGELCVVLTLFGLTEFRGFIRETEEEGEESG